MAWWPRSTPERLADLEDKFERILEQRHEPTVLAHQLTRLEKHIMAAIDDLKQAVAGLAAQVANTNAEIEDLLGKITTPGTSEADIAAAADQIRTLTGNLKAEVDKSNQQVP